MSKSSASKLLFLFLPIFALTCNVWQTSDPAPVAPTPAAATEIKSEIPFSTLEPETYQTEIVTSNFYSGEKTERKIFAARSGARRLTVFAAGEKDEIALLENGGGQTFSIHHGKKIYAENPPAGTPPAIAEDFLTAEWLNQKIPATFENLEKENSLAKFRVRLGDGEKAAAEILLYVDENLQLPVRQDFYSINGEQKTLTSTVEMKNFKLEAGEQLFLVPKNYRKVSPAELQDLLRKERN